MADKKHGLGRGIGALLDPARGRAAETPAVSADAATPRDNVLRLPLERIKPNPFQPRQRFDDASLQALAASLKRDGMIQPLVVRKRPEGAADYELIAGERRLRAAKIAGLREAPCVLIDTNEEGMGVLALLENLMREDLNALDEAEAYQQLGDVFGMTQEQIAARLGRSRPHVTNTIRLLALPEMVRAYLAAGELTAGHGRALLAVEADDDKIALAQEILAKQLSVRETEAMVKRAAQVLRHLRAGQGPKAPAPRPHGDLEERLTMQFGTKVRLTGGKTKGVIELHYFSEEELTRLADLLLK